MLKRNSKKESIIVRITHYYTYFSAKYYVKTDYSLLELNNICAYFQLLRWEFPYFLTVDDCIGQDDMVSNKLIPCEYEIDLYDNWHYFVVGKNNRQTLLSFD